MSRVQRVVPLVFVLAVALAVAPIVAGQEAVPSVTVSDQPIENGTVTIDSVVSDGPGWIVIHIEEDDAPGPVIGYEAVEDGENTDVIVEIDVDMATETLFAMLHEDTGEIGVYEFPDADPPVTVDGEVVMTAFTITAGLPEVEEEEEPEVVEAEEEEEEVLPVAGAQTVPWPLVGLLTAGTVALATAFWLGQLRQVRAAQD